jgi:hypothetical protein
MKTLHIALGIVATVGFFASVAGVIFLATYLDRQHSRNALKPYAQLRGWREVPLGTGSLMSNGPPPWWKRLLWGHAGVSVGGTWKAMPAELGMTRASKNQRATVVAIGCIQPRVGIGQILVMDRNDNAFREYQRVSTSEEPYPAQSAEFIRHFRIWGSAHDVSGMFTPEIEKAILAFPGQINKVSFDGRVVMVTWLDLEKNPAVIDAALDLAASLCLKVRTGAAGG